MSHQNVFFFNYMVHISDKRMFSAGPVRGDRFPAPRNDEQRASPN